MNPSNITLVDFSPSLNPDADESIFDCGGNLTGKTLRHSPNGGFYLSEPIMQKLVGDHWEDIDPDELARDVAASGGWDQLEAAGTHRSVWMKQRISREQAMRVFLEGWEDRGGLFDAMRDALDRAGVEPLAV